MYDRNSFVLRLGGFLLLAGLAATAAQAGVSPPGFSKTFLPATIGPGSVSTLRFEIVNSDPAISIGNLSFTDTLPAGVTLASPANAFTDCSGATVAAPSGGGTITFSGGSVGASSSCLLEVNVTSATTGVHTNVSGDLTSDAGNSGNATADLTVAVDRPGFSKSFSPPSIGLGGRSTLTFTFDNSANPTAYISQSFSDTLPTGLEVADPANVATDCPGLVLLATPGGSLIATGFSPPSLVPAGNVCTATVDVTGAAIGLHANVTEELFTTPVPGGSARSSGKATDDLQVTGGTVPLIKAFTDDPVNPGATVTLEFTLRNLNRNDSVTNIAFTDDLDATLTGLVATGLPISDVCGTGSLLTGTGLLSLTGGSLAANGGTCTFSVTLQVPAGATAGAYPNTTSSVTGDLGGTPFVSAPATETLFVNDAPLLTKTFLTNPVGAGETATVEFTITNTSSTSAATDINFQDNLTSFLSGVAVTSLPPSGFCGAGSLIFATTINGDLVLVMSDGNLAASGSCTFSVSLAIPDATSAGPYLNTTTPVEGTVDGTPQQGKAASDTLTVVAGPRLQKEFTDDPAVPGSTVTLEFTLLHDEFALADATGIAFTDDLTATLAGLTAVGLPINDVCGTGSTISGTTNLSFSGGVLAPGESCTFSVTLQIPAGAPPGVYLNETSMLTSTVGGESVVGPIAADNLDIAGLRLSKSFTDDPTIPGDLVTLEFTLDNTASAFDASGIFFTDALSAVLPGLAAEAPLPMAPCGAGSAIVGTSLLIFTGGNLTAGTSCTFSVNVRVPGGTADGTYGNTTSSVAATVDGNSVILPPAAAPLIVNSEVLLLAKSFTDDPVTPGSTVTLEFTITNTDTVETVTGITFTDDLDAALSGLTAVGLPVMNVCGAGSTLSGTGFLTLTGGTLAAGTSCTFSVTVTVPMAVPLGTTATNVTSSVSGTAAGLPVSGNPATDVLRIDFLTFAKSFDGPTAAGGMPVLTFFIENLSTTDTVTSVSFTDDLDAVISGLTATGLPQNDSCGTGSTLAGTSFLTFSGGTLLPGGTCTLQVTLQVPAGAAPGTYPNTTSDLLLAGLPAAAPATADLEVEPPPLFSKAFVPGAIGAGQTSVLTFTIDNSASAVAASALDFTDNLPVGVLVANPANASATCTGGTLGAVPGSGVITYTGGSVAAAATCTVQADVVGNAPGTWLNTTGDLTSSSGNSGAATDSLTVNPQPGFAKAFAPNPIQVGAVTTLTFTLDNSGSTVDATALDFTDNLPAGLVVATPANASTTCTGGTVTASPGSGTIAYTGGTAGAGATCTVQADVQATTAGALVNTSGDLTSSLGNSGTATDTLTVDFFPVGFAKAFTPDFVQLGEVSLLTLTIDNSANPVPVGNLAFTDNLPAGLVIGTPANASTTCIGGTLTAPAGAGTLSYSGGTVSAGGTCEVTVDVTGNSAGAFLNTTGDLTSDAGAAGPATATLTVFEGVVFSKAFLSDPVLPAGFVELEYTISNPSSLAALSDLSFSDDFGSVIPGMAAVGLPADDVCGPGSQIFGTGVVSLVGGSLAASGSCTFTITVQVPPDAGEGTFTSVTSALTFQAGAPVLGSSQTAGPASADLTVAFFEFEKTFPAEPASAGSVVALTFIITNPDPVNAATDLAFTDDLDSVLAGLVAVGLPIADVCGAGSQVAGSSVIDLTGGSLGPGETCIFEVLVQIPDTSPDGSFTNVTGPLSATVNGLGVVGDPAGIATAVLEVLGVVVEIPALGGWGLILLIGLLGLFAMRRLRMA